MVYITEIDILSVYAHVFLIHTTTGTSTFKYAYKKTLVPVVVCIRITCAWCAVTE